MSKKTKLSYFNFVSTLKEANGYRWIYHELAKGNELIMVKSEMLKKFEKVTQRKIEKLHNLAIPAAKQIEENYLFFYR